MIVKSLIGEFLHEAENTRKLLNAIPDSSLSYKPAENSWTTAELASHIAEIYNWYGYTLGLSHFDMAAYQYDKGDTSSAKNIVNKFEENAKLALSSLEKSNDDDMFGLWSMTVGDKSIIKDMPRVQVVRGFLMSHLYHHRGEMIVYLRATGNKVPGLYGPTYEESNFS